MKWNAFELISPAIEDTEKRVKPFNTREWVKLTFVSLLSNFGGGMRTGSSGGGSGGSKKEAGKAGITANAISEGAKGAGYGIIGLGVLVLAIIGLIFSYITSIFSFIYIEALTNRKYSVKKGWKEYNNLGKSFFGFKVLIGLIGLVITLIIFAVPLTKMISAGFSNYLDNTATIDILFDFLPYVLIFILFIIVVQIFLTFVYDFALVEMYLKKVKIGQAIKNVFEKIKSQKTESFVYLIAKIIVGIVSALIGLLAMLAVLIVLVIVGLIIYFILGIISKVFAIIVIVVLCLAALITLIVALLPLSIFKSYFILKAYENLTGKNIQKKI